jgi:hypothetical protein
VRQYEGMVVQGKQGTRDVGTGVREYKDIKVRDRGFVIYSTGERGIGLRSYGGTRLQEYGVPGYKDIKVRGY